MHTPSPLQRWLGRLPQAALGGALLLAGAVAVIGASGAKDKAKDTDKDKDPTVAVASAAPVQVSLDTRPVNRDQRLGTSFAPVVKKVAPSVPRSSPE